MTPSAYLSSSKERLLTDPLIANFHIVRERATAADGHIRARLTLSDGSLLEFSEYMQARSNRQIAVVTYSYHWGDAAGNLMRRWDNTPHFPALPNFPHHMHAGPAEDNVQAGQPLNIFSVLAEIAQSPQ